MADNLFSERLMEQFGLEEAVDLESISSNIVHELGEYSNKQDIKESIHDQIISSFESLDMENVNSILLKMYLGNEEIQKKIEDMAEGGHQLLLHRNDYLRTLKPSNSYSSN